MKTRVLIMIFQIVFSFSSSVLSAEEAVDYRIVNRAQEILDAYAAGADDLMDEQLLSQGAEFESTGSAAFPPPAAIPRQGKDPSYQSKIKELSISVSEAPKDYSLPIGVLSGEDQAMSGPISSAVSRIHVAELLSGYPCHVKVLPTNSIGIGQWADGFLVQPETTTNTFSIAFKILPDAESARREFDRLTVMESSGGAGHTPPKLGDQAIMFGPNRIMIRRGNVLVTVFTRTKDTGNNQELEAFIRFIDERIRVKATGVITQRISLEPR